MEPLLSVIVPVYKVEAYLRNCVDSILAQTYQNLEIILVDDGSPDNCGAICDEYASKDSRIRVIHKPNGGLSDARNAGMSIATGEYLMFVDSDDLLTLNAAQTLMGLAAQEQADIVIGNHLRFEEELPQIPTCSAAPNVHTPEEAAADMLQNGCAAWARVFRRSIHEGIDFPVGEINEDEAIVLKLYDRCQRIVKTAEVVYLYRCRPESITTTSYNPKKLIWVKHCRDNLAFIRSHHPLLELDAAKRYRGSILWALREIALSPEDFTEVRKQLVKELRCNAAIFKHAPFPLRTDRLRYSLVRHCPFFVFKAMLHIRHK